MTEKKNQEAQWPHCSPKHREKWSEQMSTLHELVIVYQSNQT